MRKALFVIPILLLAAGAIAWRSAAPAPVAKLGAGYYKKLTAVTLEDTTTGYQTIDGWFADTVDLSLQIAIDTLTGGAGATTDFTIQATNDITSASPTWVTTFTITDSTWVNNKDTIIVITGAPYGRYRFKYDLTNSDTANVVINSWLVVKYN